MKKSVFLLGLTVLTASLFVSCKSKESSYKKAYEKAAAEREQQESTDYETTPVVDVVETATVTTPVVDVSNVSVTQEKLNVMNGGSLKAYNVVCGSFSKEENANRLRNTLVDAGYKAQIAFSPEKNMYRVIASSFDDKASAVVSRNNLRNNYPDAWLLYRTY